MIEPARLWPACVLRLLLTFVLLVSNASGGAARSEKALDIRVTNLLSQMTLDEKIGQLNLLDVNDAGLESAIAAGQVGGVLNAAGAVQTNKLQHLAIEHSRLHIPLLFGYDVIHGYRTIFPIPLGLASTFDPSAAERMARISAREAAASGIRWTFSPMADIARDPRWGRVAEGAGEDPVLGSAMAAAYVRGYQGEDLSASGSIAACAKHYAGYGASEGGRDYNGADMSERRLREVYLPPFKSAAEAGAASFMSAFNTLNDVPATANSFTLRQILKGEWGFRGFVVSDWKAIAELVAHGIAADKKEAARDAISAGVDMDMASGAYLRNLADLVRSGAIPVSLIDDAVRRILQVKFALGLFEHPFADEQRESAALLTAENRRAAREIAQRSIVLLRNEDNILPLPKTADSIAVIGPLADRKADMLGNWSGKGEADDAVSVLEAIRARMGPATLYSKGVDISSDSTEGIAAAVEVARQADVVLLVLGESADMSGEAASRSSLDLPGQQQKLLEAVAAAGKPIVLVLMSGRPLAISRALERAAGILEAWFPGVEGGNAIADIIFGDVNSTGRLPVTFPRAAGQVPIYYSHLNTGRPPDADPKYHTGYLDLPASPLYPFGYGLSYSKFAFGNLRAGAQLRAQEDFQASVDVTNTSTRAGEELVQMYIREPSSSIARPVLELKQFVWVALQPGETRQVTFTIKRAELASLQPGMRYAVTPGAYRIAIGPNSAELLETRFEVSNAKESPARNAGAHVQQAAARGKRTKVESGVR